MIQNQAKTFAKIVSSLVVILILVNVLVSAQVSYWGYQLGQLQFRAENIEEANRLLQNDISKITSLTKYTNNARSLGFTHDVAYTQISGVSEVASTALYQP